MLVYNPNTENGKLSHAIVAHHHMLLWHTTTRCYGILSGTGDDTHGRFTRPTVLRKTPGTLCLKNFAS